MSTAPPPGGVSDPPFPDPDARNVLVPGCARCPALAGARECIAWGNGPLDADVVVVGEAPAAGDAPEASEASAVGDPATGESATADESATGEPGADPWRGGNWTGVAYTSRHSGRRVRALFADLGDEPYYTNAVKCFPSDGEGSNREPTDAERRRCGAHLLKELAQVAPAAVVPTGKHATASVFALAGRDLEGFLEAVLSPVAWTALDATVVPILHPSYQDVWVSRLGYGPDEYRTAVGAAVEDALSERA